MYARHFMGNNEGLGLPCPLCPHILHGQIYPQVMTEYLVLESGRCKPLAVNELEV